MPTMWLSDSQKIGVAFCSGGGFFLTGGVVMFFDRAMLAMGNILFLLGLLLLLGPQRTLQFFLRRPKLKGTLTFTLGILLILFRWPLIGFLVELYGILVLFGDFFRMVAGFVRNVPVVGPVLARGLEGVGRVSGGGGEEGIV